VILVWKPVWLSRPGARKPAHGATVSAQIRDGVLSEPELAPEPAFKGVKLPAWEKDKLKGLEPILILAQEHMAK
jgi:hypothetical protein